ncbi:MAG TPA: hypothetical protein VKE22_18545 [Haliangiales bacterium]|nr:hypothetical protein [Haliangiales bacterium]
MNQPTWIKSFDELVAALQGANVPHQASAANQTIEVRTGAAALGGSLFLRWERQLPYVQIIQPMIQNVPAARVPAVEAAIGRLNNVAVLAGLGLDYASNLLYFRVTARILPPDGLRSDMLQALMQGVVVNAGEFLEPLRRVVGGAAGEDVLSFAKAPGN